MPQKKQAEKGGPGKNSEKKDELKTNRRKTPNKEKVERNIWTKMPPWRFLALSQGNQEEKGLKFRAGIFEKAIEREQK